MAALNIRINDDLKKQASELFADLGMDMSTAINIFLRKAVQCDGIPFEIKRETPNAETLEAFKEGEEILKHPEKYPSYDSAEELFAAILGDVENKTADKEHVMKAEYDFSSARKNPYAGKPKQ